MIVLLLKLTRAVFKSKNNIASTVTVSIASFEAIGELQRKRLRQSRAQCLAGIHERVDNFCKRRAEYPRRSFIILHTEHGQAQALYTGKVGIPCGGWCNGVDFTGISKFPGGTEHAQTVCTGPFFLHPRTRAWERS